MTDKHKFIQAKAQGMSNTQAALAANPKLSPKSAGNIGMRLSKQVDVQTALAKAFKKHDVTLESIIKVHSEAMNATRLELIDGIYHDSELPEHSTRLSAAKSAYSIMKDIKETNEAESRKYIPNDPNMSDTEIVQALFKPKDDV